VQALRREVGNLQAKQAKLSTVEATLCKEIKEGEDQLVEVVKEVRRKEEQWRAYSECPGLRGKRRGRSLRSGLTWA